jgi:plasmid segregation protein ParM
VPVPIESEEDMTIPTFPFGWDYGNSESCGVLLIDRQQPIVKSIPSMVAPGTLQRLRALDHVIQQNEFVFKDETGEFYVGDLALSQASMAFSERGDLRRYHSENAKRMLLTLASSMIDYQEFALEIVTGIPIRTYVEDPEARERVKQALSGTYHFTLNNRVRTIHVNVQKTIMEGAGANISYGLPQRVPQGVIDIGGRTTDLFATIGQVAQQNRCSNIPLGVETVGDMLRQLVQQEYGRLLLQGEIRDILRGFVNHTTPTLYNEGKPMPAVSELLYQALQEVGSEIASFVAETWGLGETGKVGSDLAQILLIGGGTYYFGDAITRRVPHVRIPDYPEFANATGYAHFAAKIVETARAMR